MSSNDEKNNVPNDPYAEEAEKRWGHTDAYKQSQERVKKMTKTDWDGIGAESDAILKNIVKNMDKGPESEEVQNEIAKHYDALRAFYEPSLEMYRGLGSMYGEDERFAAYYQKYHSDLPGFMQSAMHAYCDRKSVS